MLKRTLMIAVSGAALFGATNANAFVHYDVEAIQNESFSGTSFSQNLAREYKDFATFEAYQMYDWIDAEHFAEKAIVAHNGNAPMPEELANWSIKEKYLPEMREARSNLMAAMSNGARDVAPAEAARAQAKFDCWVEQQEENWQWDDIAACKGAFYAAMTALQGAMAPKPVAKIETKTETVDMPVTQLGAVFFEFDKANLTQDAERKLNTMVNSLDNKDEIELHVVGHTDTSGPSDYNQELSRKRAQAVVDGLRERGMNVAELKQLDVEAKGERDPAVATGDGVRLQANRRVEIYAYAKQPISVTTTKQTAINPAQ